MNSSPKIIQLDSTISFPPVEEAWEGLLAIGGDLQEARLIAAYESGIFPWYGENDPILWWAPETRSVLDLDDLHISKSMRNILNQQKFELRIDTAFDEVIRQCADVRKNSEGTWISKDIIQAYSRLHKLGLAHSFECWRNGDLVGGLTESALAACSLEKVCFRSRAMHPRLPLSTSCTGPKHEVLVLSIVRSAILT